jgi:hypothetical protein
MTMHKDKHVLYEGYLMTMNKDKHVLYRGHLMTIHKDKHVLYGYFTEDCEDRLPYSVKYHSITVNLAYQLFIHL